MPAQDPSLHALSVAVLVCQVYLRNLGIEQSPGSILAPFLPRGLLRELELSPSEPRTLQEPLDTLARSPPQAQGTALGGWEGTELAPLGLTPVPGVDLPSPGGDSGIGKYPKL